MLYILYLYILSFTLITNCSEEEKKWDLVDDAEVQQFNINIQTASTQWHDLNQDFIQAQNETRANFIQAHNIVKRLRTKQDELDDEENPYDITDKTIISTTKNQIQELYRLGRVSPNKIIEHEFNINNSCLSLLHTLRQQREIIPYHHLGASLVVAEIIVADIFRYAQGLGLYPNGFPANI
jgi:hypothetical protein